MVPSGTICVPTRYGRAGVLRAPRWTILRSGWRTWTFSVSAVARASRSRLLPNRARTRRRRLAGCWPRLASRTPPSRAPCSRTSSCGCACHAAATRCPQCWNEGVGLCQTCVPTRRADHAVARSAPPPGRSYSLWYANALGDTRTLGRAAADHRDPSREAPTPPSGRVPRRRRPRARSSEPLVAFEPEPGFEIITCTRRGPIRTFLSPSRSSPSLSPFASRTRSSRSSRRAGAAADPPPPRPAQHGSSRRGRSGQPAEPALAGPRGHDPSRLSNRSSSRYVAPLPEPEPVPTQRRRPAPVFPPPVYTETEPIPPVAPLEPAADSARLAARPAAAATAGAAAYRVRRPAAACLCDRTRASGADATRRPCRPAGPGRPLRAGPGIRPCQTCQLPLSAKARFCRRCGTAAGLAVRHPRSSRRLPRGRAGRAPRRRQRTGSDS